MFGSLYGSQVLPWKDAREGGLPHQIPARFGDTIFRSGGELFWAKMESVSRRGSANRWGGIGPADPQSLSERR